MNTRSSITQPPLAPCADASSKQQIKLKYKLSHQQTGLSPHSALPSRGNTNEQRKKNLAQISPYTNHWTKLRKAETKRNKVFNLKGWGKKTSNTISLKKNNEEAEKYHTNEETRNTEVQINEEE